MTINLNEYIGTSVAIPLAKQGEYGKEVTFDFSVWVERFGSGSIGWSIQRPQDTAAYLLPSTEDGTVSTITLTETESQKYGYGLLEVFYVNTGETEKRISQTFSIRIDKSLQNVGEAPSPWQSYVDAVHADALAAEEAASSILDLTATATVDSSVGTPSVSVEVSTEDDHKNMAFAFSNIKGEQGEQGETGNGISSVSVAKTATVGNVDTYTMTVNYTDGDSDTATFDVTNGEVTEEEFRKAFPTDTASGSIASYPDGADMPVTDLKVAITPVQDLHGYANPWVGGGGKNKLDVSDGDYTGMNTSTGEPSGANPLRWASGFVLLNAGTYTFSFGSGGFCVGIFYYDTSESFVSYEAKSFSTTPQTITLTGSQKIKLYCGASDHDTLVTSVAKMQLELGSSPTPWTPYSNICPITGWTGANVYRTGKNLCSSELGRYNWAIGIRYVNDTGAYCATEEKIKIKGGATYVVSFANSGTTNGVYVSWFNGETYLSNSNVYGSPYSVQAPPNANLCAITIRNTENYTGDPTVTNLQLEVGSSATSYEPFVASNTYSIPFGQTVYGGTLDVTTGVLTVDRAYQSLTGSDVSGVATEGGIVGRWRLTLVAQQDRPATANVPFAISNKYQFVQNYTTAINTNNSFTFSSNRGQMVIRDDSLTTSQAVTDSLNAVPLIMVYTNYSPQSVQLSPTEVKSLLGQNNIWADCGDSEVEYLADVTLYIQKLTGSTEDDMVANQNIANNKYFLVGSRLFFSTSAIAQGASIVVGTNCTETNLADALNALNS